jgi:signal transduction histidine kinase
MLRGRVGARHQPERAAPSRPSRLRGIASSEQDRLIRVAGTGLFALAVMLIASSLPARFDEHRDLTSVAIRDVAPIQERLDRAGVSLEWFAAYHVTIDLLLAACFIGVAALIFRRRAGGRTGLFVAFMLLALGTDVFGMGGLADHHPAWQWAARVFTYSGWVALWVFAYLFPDGRFVPRWTRWLVLPWMAIEALDTWFRDARFHPDTWPLLDATVGILLLGTLIGAQVYRYRRVSGPAERQQTKWVIYAIALWATGTFLHEGARLFAPTVTDPGAVDVAFAFLGRPFIALMFMLIPLSLAIAILRHRLWDIDVIINRTLVYLALTAGIVAMYVIIVGSLGAMFQTRGNFAVSLIATGIVAVLFHPVRERLQHGVNRMMYGERDDPYAALSRLGRRLEGSLSPDAVLPTIVETVREALNLPYAAMTLGTGDGAVSVASGTPAHPALRLPLTHQQETVGELLLAPRVPGETFSPADQRLLDDLARQIGVAAHNVRLNQQAQQLSAELQRSRERLVIAREEERRRLRRELHDGLAPTLAALNLKAGTIRSRVRSDPDAAESLIDDWRSDVRSTIGNIRRLAYELRPPVLDELGLAAAIQDRISRIEDGALRVTLDAPDSLGALPAAVELAAYRISQEALMNVERHAHAQTCHVRLWECDGPPAALCLAIVDDGVGLPDSGSLRVGVGLLSIRERAAELGGSCVIERDDSGGTRVVARLPVVREQE